MSKSHPEQVPPGHVEYVYRVWDRETETFWQTPRGKRVWNKPAHAKNSWNCFKSSWRNTCRFTDQTRYVVRKYRLTFVEEV